MKHFNKLTAISIAVTSALSYSAHAADEFTCTDAEFTKISAIQGSGFKSPKIEDGKYESNEAFVVKGIVTARSNRNDGFFMQSAMADVDDNNKTSEGIFVYLGKGKDAPKWLVPGSQVCVKGKVEEKFGLTQITSDEARLAKTSEDKAPIPVATEFKLLGDETYTQAMERHEGMKIKLVADSEMVVTSPYGYNGRYNSMTLSHKTPLFKPTQIHMAGSKEVADLQKANDARRLEIETDLSAPKGHIPYFPDFNAETGFMRVGDTLQNIEGAIGYSFGKYRLYVTNEIKPTDFTRTVERADIETPTIAEKGDLRVASFNVLNYFTSHSEIGGALNASCKDQADADAVRGCNRGAKAAKAINQTVKQAFELQRTKIVKSLKAMNADIVGLMEIENNGFADDSAIHDLVTELNKEMSGDDVYKFVKIAAKDMNKDKFFGTDAIMVGMLYRPAKAMLDGDAIVIKTPEQHAPAEVATRTKDDKTEKSPKYDKFQRYSLGQTFTIGENKLTIVVNHFKSKGSGCLEDWIDFADKSDPKDLQGRCNDFRVSAAEAVGHALKTIKGDVLIIGDLNAYGKEDPLQVLTNYSKANNPDKVIHTAAYTTLDGKELDKTQREITEGFGYINLNTKLHGADTYSYKWAGELGNLDHALANQSLAGKVKDIEDWHINSAESTMFEYASKYTGDLKKAKNVFSSSDHDPVIIAIDYTKPKKKSSGSLGFLALGLLSLAGIRRRLIK
ncbi:ExeM/NucH family extracellular endonuclease [Parashewanella tropica]|uniref:ExeM/NucH family extracellular endonuclease n=1 Tax=Parashewanella tropica TaxID=2547970 RepID=UPI00105A6CFD|nr:ExeM/NucH family extracellular endonuclease [Parashewanella tropica]